MKYIISVVILFIIGNNVFGQEPIETREGTVSYVTSQSVYVKFASTEQINVGDTLFFKQENQIVAALLVTSLSSISVVCQPIAGVEVKVGSQMVAKTKKVVSEAKPVEAAIAITIAKPTQTIDSATLKKVVDKQEIHGRLGVSSYLNFSNSPAGNSTRMRYTFTMNAKNISDSKLSAETYISFTHRSDHWSDIQDNIFNGLKIYSLALNYKINDNHQLWLGRKINPKLSNIGAVDGLQYEAKLKAFTIGLVGGFRPDYTDYSFSSKLPQFGVFASHELKTKNGMMQNSIAFFEQRNSGATDRRFAYFQHSNSMVKNLYLFGSVEVDLYQNVNGVQSSNPRLSNMYFMARYRIIKPLSISLSYSSRTNIIYYESYKDIVDRLLNEDATQGLMAQITYRPLKMMTVGLKGSYRLQKKDLKPTQNAYAYITYSRIPGINASATLSATNMQTAYLTGNIYSLNFSKDLLKGGLYGSIGYRYVDYSFYNGEMRQKQNMAELNLTARITKKLYCSLNYEGTFEKSTNLNHVYINITQRF